MTSERMSRVAGIDVLRGLVIVLMALDHTRDFFHAGAMSGSPTDLTTTTPLLFFTRWVTHFCAPVFLLLAGLGVALRLDRPGQSPAAVRRYLVTRGLWLIVLEVVVMRLAITFSLSLQWPLLLLVLWAIGWSMIGLALVLRVPRSILLACSVAVIALHNVFDGLQLTGPAGALWTLLRQPGVIAPGGAVVLVGYPLVPWLAVMVAGFALGPIYREDAARRRQLLWRAGTALVVGFVLLRVLNVYGDPVPWTAQARPGFTVLSFLNTTKYPPSLQFLCMTLGPALMALAWLDGVRPDRVRPLLVLGRAPLVFYVAHFWLLHLLSVAASLVTYGRDAWRFAFMPLPSMGGPAQAFPAGFGYPLWVTYVAWLIVVVLLYPLLPRARRDVRANV